MTILLQEELPKLATGAGGHDKTSTVSVASRIRFSKGLLQRAYRESVGPVVLSLCVSLHMAFVFPTAERFCADHYARINVCASSLLS